jgi:putative protease
MKSAEYVASVVSAYRTVLDAKKGNEKYAIAEAKEKLENAMGRKSSDGFLQGNVGDIVLAKRKGGIGRIIGKVERLQGQTISFRLGDTIHVGDRLRIQPGNDRPGQGFTVRKMFLGKRAVKRAAKNSIVAIPVPVKGRVHVADLVFKLATGKAFTMSEEACCRRLNAAPLHANSVCLHIDCNESSSSLTVMAAVKSVNVKKTYQVEMIPANKTPLNRKILFKVFSHTGFKTLALEDLQVGGLPIVVIKPSRLKEIRREFYTHLDGLVEKELQKQAQLKVKTIHDEILSPVTSGKLPEKDKSYIVTDHLPDLQIIREYPDLHFVLPVTRPFLNGAQDSILDTTWRQQIIWDLPSILFDKDWAEMQGMVEGLLTMGFSCFRINNIAHFEFFAEFSDVQLIAGSWLYILNSQTVSALRALGCQKYCLSIEDDKENIRLLQGIGRPEELLITVYGAIDLFTSRIPVPVNEQEFTLENDKGEQFYLKESGGLTITQAEKPFSLIGNLKELRGMNCSNFILDMRGIGFRTKAGQEIMNGFREDRIIPGTVKLNYNRGLA